MWAGIIAMVLFGLGLMVAIIAEPDASEQTITVIPAMPQYSPTNHVSNDDAYEWAMYWHEAYEEYEDEFTALFNSYETKRAKNGALMIRRGNQGSFKFAKKG